MRTTHDGGLTQQQKYTAAGLLGVIAAVAMGGRAVPAPVVIATSIGYGIGSSASVALYRTAGLMKNGRAEENQYGNGAMAGLAIAFGLTAMQTIPDILSGSYISGISNMAAVIAGTIGVAAGFLQSRGTFVAQTAVNSAANQQALAQ